MIARIARTLYANLYFAMAASLMSINWQQRGVSPVDWIPGNWPLLVMGCRYGRAIFRKGEETPGPQRRSKGPPAF